MDDTKKHSGVPYLYTCNVSCIWLEEHMPERSGRYIYNTPEYIVSMLAVLSIHSRGLFHAAIEPTSR